MKLAILNIERISIFKKLMIKLSEMNCENLIKNICVFIEKSIKKEDYHFSIEQLIKFCKKFSKYSNSHQNLFKNKIHFLALDFIKKF